MISINMVVLGRIVGLRSVFDVLGNVWRRVEVLSKFGLGGEVDLLLSG